MENIKKPYYVDFSVTPYCNLACPFCSAGAANRMETENKKPFTIEMIENIFDQFYENEILRVSLEGGEPFSRSDIIEIMHLADKHNFWYMINTNATLITEELAKEISKTSVEKLCITAFHYDKGALHANAETYADTDVPELLLISNDPVCRILQ